MISFFVSYEYIFLEVFLLLQIITLSSVIVIPFATKVMLYPYFIHVHIFIWCHSEVTGAWAHAYTSFVVVFFRCHAKCRPLIEKYLCQTKSQREPTALRKTVWMKNECVNSKQINQIFTSSFSKMPLLWEAYYRNNSYCYSKTLLMVSFQNTLLKQSDFISFCVPQYFFHATFSKCSWASYCSKLIFP